MGRFLAALLVSVITFPAISFAQNVPPSDPQALAFAAQSLSVMTGGTTISDITLSGNATWTLGSDPQTGTVTFMALGTGESRMDLSLSGGTWTEIRDASTGIAQGEWISNSVPTLFALHNCWTDAAWFFPALSAMVTAPNSNFVLSYVGQENWQGASVQHLQAYQYLGQNGTGIQALSRVDYYLDATSLLPIALTFNAHPDNDASTNLPVQILFLGYHSINGAQVPSHIQKLFNGQLLLDVTITSVVFNSGLQLSTFALQ